MTMGVKQKDVLLQFLVEALVLATSGGIIGTSRSLAREV
jgi:ABC-type antimicrobial peptide transport system permease subunit